ncbi:rac GTPase-activating protein 1 [Bombina bombina]|uniref:rac GTPase-activating protein 1 n=1 Tax=Bombina bombina TaxID=8345 RepID=UPI00235ADE2A|nr:rac GTPase-activating protein 1 [Bombina bombina]
MATSMMNLRNLFEQLMRQVDGLNEGIEPQFMQLAKNFEDFRRKWQKMDHELGKSKEMLMKAETERSALEVKLKHARNQVDVEIKRRQRAEADCEKLERQIQLIRELLMCDTSGSIQLSEQQKNALAFLNNRTNLSNDCNGTRRLSTIDESASILSDISFDKTEDSLDWDSSLVRNVRLRKREKRRSSRHHTEGPPVPSKRNRSFGLVVDQDNAPSHASKYSTAWLARKGIKEENLMTWPPCSPDLNPIENPWSIIKCEIYKEGKQYTSLNSGSIADFVPLTSPMIPSIVVHCVSEIEQRGLHETGLYRISGCDRTVKDLKEKFLRGKSVPLLSKVDDIHAVCGFLKDFLRNLKEPLLTSRLNKTFMAAAEIPDDDNSIAAIYQAVDELPAANRDTLAYLMIHLQRVAQSPDCRMDVTNLAKVFGPTLVGHAVPDPDPMTILQDTRRQPKVVERLMSLPAEYWSQFMMVENMDPSHIISNANVFNTPQTPDMKVSMLGPLTTPEHQITKTPSTSSLSQKMKSTLGKSTPKFGSKSKSATSITRQGNFFASPLLK